MDIPPCLWVFVPTSRAMGGGAAADITDCRGCFSCRKGSACAVCWLLSLCLHSRAGSPSPSLNGASFARMPMASRFRCRKRRPSPRAASERSNATQTNFLIESGPITYLVSLIQLEKGTGPKNPDRTYFQNLMKNYTEGSSTTLRTQQADDDRRESRHRWNLGCRQFRAPGSGAGRRRPHLHGGLRRAEGAGEQRRPDPIPEFVQADQLTAPGSQASEIRLLRLPSGRADARTKREHRRDCWLPILPWTSTCRTGGGMGERVG